MLTSLDEERCMTEYAVAQNIERLKIRIKYLEKDNKDLQMDLEDVEATLQINKNIINTLVDTRTDIAEDSLKLVKKFQKEAEQTQKRCKRISAERETMMAELLVAEQLAKNVVSKEEEIANHYDIEVNRLIDQVEKKEYTLQLLEQRLFDCEKFLRKWGRDDPFIREQLKYLKINPDLKKKKISNCVEENKVLKQQLKESLDEIEQLHKKIVSMSKHPDDTTFLKESIIHNRSRIDMFMANEMFGDDLELNNEDNGEGEITNIATQASTKRNKEQNYGAMPSSLNRKSKKNKGNIEKELEPFESRTYHQVMIDVAKIRSLKDAYPEEYKEKLENNQDLLQQRLKAMEKEINQIKQENIFLKDQLEIYQNNYQKVLHALEKSKKFGEIKQKQVFDLNEDELFENIDTPRPTPEQVRAEIEMEFNNIRSLSRKSNLIETFKKVDQTIEKFNKKSKASNMFTELSSIVVDPHDLPKDIKAFVKDTFESNQEATIPSILMKQKVHSSKNMNIKVPKVKEYNDSSRRDHL